MRAPVRRVTQPQAHVVCTQSATLSDRRSRILDYSPELTWLLNMGMFVVAVLLVAILVVLVEEVTNRDRLRNPETDSGLTQRILEEVLPAFLLCSSKSILGTAARPFVPAAVPVHDMNE